jgi:hypothetical protein
VGANTLLRWMKEPEFTRAYREARRQAVGQSIARLQQATSAAAATLMKIMVDQNVSASTRVRAADSIFNHAAKAIEIEDIEARVEYSGPRHIVSVSKRPDGVTTKSGRASRHPIKVGSTTRTS